MLTLDAALVSTNDDRLEELVVLSLLVTLLDSLDRVVALFALAKNQALEGQLVPLPSLIAVHGVVPADDRGDLANADLLDGRQQLLQVTGSGLGVSVAAVAEEVDEDLGDAGFLGSPEEGIQVRLLRMLKTRQSASARTTPFAPNTNHTTVGHQAAKVKAPIAILGRRQNLLDHIIVAELALLNGQVDADDVLPDDTAGADVEMPDFGVAHEAFGETDGQRRRVEFGETSCALRELVHDGSLGGGNGVAIFGGLLGGDTPAVNHD
jgi:hypothetical protein